MSVLSVEFREEFLAEANSLVVTRVTVDRTSSPDRTCEYLRMRPRPRKIAIGPSSRSPKYSHGNRGVARQETRPPTAQVVATISLAFAQSLPARATLD